MLLIKNYETLNGVAIENVINFCRVAAAVPEVDDTAAVL